MIDIQNLNISLGVSRILQSDSFSITNGLWSIVGRNGSGKSSFINSIAGNHPLNGGSILINKHEHTSFSAIDKSKLISIVYTKPSVFGQLSVFDVVMLGRLPYTNAFGKANETDVKICEKALNDLKISHYKEKRFSILSDGEKQMVMIARVLAQDTPIILLDEPTAFLDVVNRQEIIKILKKITVDYQKTILFSTHDLELIPKLCDGLIWIEDNYLFATENSSRFTSIIAELFANEV